MRIEIPKSIQKKLFKALSRARQKEIGGILMAEQCEPGVFRIADFSVDTKTGGAAHFVRSPEHHRQALEQFFRKTGHDYSRFNYLGEWHSHPNHEPLPSPVDIAAMNDLIFSERSIPFAVLLIVRAYWWKRIKCSALLFQHMASPSPVEIHQLH